MDDYVKKAFMAWKVKYRYSRTAGLMELFCFFFASCGCDPTARNDWYSPLSFCTDDAELLSKFIDSAHDTNTTSSPLLNDRSPHICSRFRELWENIALFSVHELLEGDGYLLSSSTMQHEQMNTNGNSNKLLYFLHIASSSKCFAIRHGATLATIYIIDSLIALLIDKGNILWTGDLGRIRNELERLIRSLFIKIMKRRTRDVALEIRVQTIHAIGRWICSRTEVFVATEWLKYIGWALNDGSSHLRLVALNQVHIILNCVHSLSQIQLFIDHFKGRFTEMICDADVDVSCAALELLFLLSCKNLLDLNSLHHAASIVLDPNPTVQKLAIRILIHFVVNHDSARGISAWICCNTGGISENSIHFISNLSVFFSSHSMTFDEIKYIYNLLYEYLCCSEECQYKEILLDSLYCLNFLCNILVHACAYDPHCQEAQTYLDGESDNIYFGSHSITVLLCAIDVVACLNVSEIPHIMFDSFSTVLAVVKTEPPACTTLLHIFCQAQASRVESRLASYIALMSDVENLFFTSTHFSVYQTCLDTIFHFLEIIPVCERKCDYLNPIIVHAFDTLKCIFLAGEKMKIELLRAAWNRIRALQAVSLKMLDLLIFEQLLWKTMHFFLQKVLVHEFSDGSCISTICTIILNSHCLRFSFGPESMQGEKSVSSYFSAERLSMMAMDNDSALQVSMNLDISMRAMLALLLNSGGNIDSEAISAASHFIIDLAIMFQSSDSTARREKLTFDHCFMSNCSNLKSRKIEVTLWENCLAHLNCAREELQDISISCANLDDIDFSGCLAEDFDFQLKQTEAKILLHVAPLVRLIFSQLTTINGEYFFDLDYLIPRVVTLSVNHGKFCSDIITSLIFHLHSSRYDILSALSRSIQFLFSSSCKELHEVRNSGCVRIVSLSHMQCFIDEISKIIVQVYTMDSDLLNSMADNVVYKSLSLIFLTSDECDECGFPLHHLSDVDKDALLSAFFCKGLYSLSCNSSMAQLSAIRSLCTKIIHRLKKNFTPCALSHLVDYVNYIDQVRLKYPMLSQDNGHMSINLTELDS